MANQARGGKGSGELLHIVIMTAFMTGGFLALISGIFYFFVIPDRIARLNAQVEDHNKLMALLDPKKASKESKEIWEYRDRVRAVSKNQSAKTIRDIVTEQLGGLSYSRLPPTTTRGDSKSATKDHIQQIELKEAPIGEVLSYVGRVKQANPGVQVGHIGLTRRSRSGPALGAAAGAPADEDRWNATIDFYTSVTEARGGAGAKAAPKAEESAPEAPAEPAPPAEGGAAPEEPSGPPPAGEAEK